MVYGTIPKEGLSPKNLRATMSAATELITTGVILRTTIRLCITSRAKKTPPIGALKVADMPPAAPHKTSVFTHS